jgi:2-amino-4-hydroxy-6-hydroxymethyldihydropteridine diphosphokinase
MTFACLGLGSNLGDSFKTLKDAIACLQKEDSIQLNKCSSCYVSKPWGLEEQPDFLNAVIGVQTQLSADELLSRLQAIELRFLRERIEKWGPRTLDIDILCYGDLHQNDPSLSLPHPYFSERDFVLVPLHEICPDLIIAEKPVSEWLELYLNHFSDRPLPEKIKATLT